MRSPLLSPSLHSFLTLSHLFALTLPHLLYPSSFFLDSPSPPLTHPRPPFLLHEPLTHSTLSPTHPLTHSLISSVMAVNYTPINEIPKVRFHRLTLPICHHETPTLLSVSLIQLLLHYNPQHIRLFKAFGRPSAPVSRSRSSTANSNSGLSTTCSPRTMPPSGRPFTRI